MEFSPRSGAIKVRARLGVQTTEVEYERHMGYEILAAQIGSFFDGVTLVLLDALGRELIDDDEKTEFSSIESMTYFEEEDKTAPPAVAVKCLDVYCVIDQYRTANGACSRNIAGIVTGDSHLNAEDELLLQPLYKIVDTGIRLCGYCASQCPDPSLLVYEPHAIQAFACEAQQAVDMGILPAPNARTSTSTDTGAGAAKEEMSAAELELQCAAYTNHPVNLYLRRSLMNAAILAQASGGFLGKVPLATTPLLPSILCAQQKEQQTNFTRRVQGARQTSLAHEEPAQQQAAREAVDYACVHREALLWQAQQIAEGKEAPAEDALFLAGLLAWFKRHFFKWCNKPLCQYDACPASLDENACKCADDMSHAGMVEPNAEERAGGAGRVEVYTCKRCNTITRFPRYNNPARLLQTKTGRCGEWANCFGLICRALGLDSRYVIDFTDHVWIEVWMESEGRYCHCDPCENAMDAPLIYEHGWGKKLTYILSFSRHGCVDATAKYTRQLATVMERRGSLGGGLQEAWLRQEVSIVNRQLRDTWKAQQGARENAAGYLRGSSIITADLITTSSGSAMGALLHGMEAIEKRAAFTSINADRLLEERSWCLNAELTALALRAGSGSWKLAEMVGRTSGDMQWRRARGELGAESDK